VAGAATAASAALFDAMYLSGSAVNFSLHFALQK
jgi:hypothetical protein